MSDFNNGTGIRVKKTAELVAANIRRAIIRGETPPGENLPAEAKLIERFEVSRPTIREALRILEFEGLISVSRGARGGAKVREPDSEFISRAMGIALQARGVTVSDVYEARTIIEPAAARIAAETRPREAAEVLRAHIEQEYEALKTETVIPHLTAEFHSLLVQQSGNQTLALIALALHNLVRTHQMLAHRNRHAEPQEASKKRSRLGVKSHEKLVELIEQGDGEGAKQHWLLHMEHTKTFYLDRFAQTSIIDILEG